MKPPGRRITGASAAEAVHRALREDILDGRMRPGAILDQAAIGRSFGMSATPVREALRMLHEEGLVVAEPQKRARVIGFDPGRVEALYAERMSVEAIGAALTATRGEPDVTAALQGAFDRMEAAAGPSDAMPSRDWHAAHRDFHQVATSALGPVVGARIAANIDRSRHYVEMHRSETTDGWLAPRRWHRETLDAILVGDAARSAAAMAADLGHAVLALIEFMSPNHEPRLVRETLAYISARAAGDDMPGPRPFDAVRA